MQEFSINEKSSSQIPALQVLMKLGYEYLGPSKTLAARGRNIAQVLLDDILREQLKRINRISYKGEEYLFSEENIQAAIQKLKDVPHDGLQRANEAVYDMLTLGTTLEQTIEGTSRHFSLRYVDWEEPANNVFHVVAEYTVERARSAETRRPDIVLFVNGIPFVVIECKAPHVEVGQAVEQNIRNQGESFIPRLFTYVQLLLALNKNEAKYATVGTSEEFWSVWRELEDSEEDVASCVNKVLSDADKDALFSGEFAAARGDFEEGAGGRLVTGQDRCIYSLCRPARLLELVHRFIIFDKHVKKIARYQQFFLVRSALATIKQRNEEDIRKGGIVWHTQGSGKSITMVMLARALSMDAGLPNLRLLLVTDRKDLDQQLGNTFAACGLEKKRATSGRDLARHIRNKVGIITTLINKFDTALSAARSIDDSPDIVVLVDESHRTNFGELAASMRGMLPKACFIGFTGTPLLKKERHSFLKFGDLIKPAYTVRQAIQDKVVVPLLYEGRHVEITQDKKAIDLWFDRHTEGLSENQKADLKRKFSSTRQVHSAAQVVYMRAYDINEHFRDHWQSTDFKAQLVAPTKAAALQYHEYLREFEDVSSAVIISQPDMREGYKEVGQESKDKVVRFWNQMMKRYGTEESYNRSIIDGFQEPGDPEILIVVDKLLTGFDAPRNTVLYLCKPLREHTLLQAIARVNRLHANKEFGYIVDYEHVLEELDKALGAYEVLAGFDEQDLTDLLASIDAEVAQLPQRHADLWDIFHEIKGSRDEERYERLLEDEKLRDNFYSCFTEYGKCLSVALSSDKFVRQSDPAQLQQYKDDMKRFYKLKQSVKIRYADAVDYRDYEPRIKKLLDTHIHADEVSVIHPARNIVEYTALPDSRRDPEVQEPHGVYQVEPRTTAAQADAIAHRTKRTIHDKMEQDPALYKKLSELIQAAIDDHRRARISEREYLKRAQDIEDRVAQRRHDDVPDAIREDEEACAYFGVVKLYLAGLDVDATLVDEIAVKIACAVKRVLQEHWKVDFWKDSSAQKALKSALDDFYYDEVGEKYGVKLSSDQMDKISYEALRVAKSRRPV